MMNRKQTSLAVVLLALVTLLPACKPAKDSANIAPTAATASATLKFQALNVGKEINADHSVPPLTLFTPDDKIIASVQTDGAAKGVPISVKLIAMSNGQMLSELSQQVTATGLATNNFEFPKSTAWKLGRYLVEVTINDKFEARQEIEVRQDGPPN